jgi:phosphoserine phosphatase
MTYQNGTLVVSKGRYIATVFPRHTAAATITAGSNGIANGVPGPVVDGIIKTLNSSENIKPATYLGHQVLGERDGTQIVEVYFSSYAGLEPAVFVDNVAALEDRLGIQVSVQKDSPFRRMQKLACFDMDSTLIEQEVIDEIARKIGVKDQVSAITERAMNGELDFTASLRERCRLLRGVPSSVFDELKGEITITPGARDLVKALKRLGYKTAVLSGGFTPLANWVAEQLGLDFAYANNLEISADGNTLTGEVLGDIVHAERKRDLVQQIASELNIPLAQVLVVGDGANDLKMMGVAGLGVAFNAKVKVQRNAPTRLNSPTMLDLLYLLGFNADDISHLLQVDDVKV